ncbi:unnamed protein product [Meloidogyne enterolobii]|uniref:Uncharacterized protein n=1 Tax=Meloidogyne enterolobii TaxID=390850 RepID=A0ACB0Y0A7_MELEN
MNSLLKFNKIIYSPLLFFFLVLCIIITTDRTVIASTPLSHPKFFLSCRVIAGICQGDIRCLEEMSTRFTNCYLESLLERGGDAFGRELEFDDGPIVRKRVPDKRAPAFKLMKVLMMKDRVSFEAHIRKIKTNTYTRL